MNKTFVKVIAGVIPIRAWRKQIRSFLEDLDLLLFVVQIFKFSFRSNNKHRVLLIEPNRCHGEIVPGISKYFLNLGYKVDILLDHYVAKQRPFCRCHEPHIAIYTHIPYSLKFILRNKRLKEYDFICLLTTAYFASGNKKKKYLSFKEIYGAIPAPKKETIFIEHELADVERFNEINLLKDGKIFTLVPFSFFGIKTPALNPHYFGDISITPLNNPVIFLIIGELSVKFKNSSQIIEAVQELNKNGINNFRIWAVGREQQNFIDTLPDEVRSFFSFKGEVNFPDLYSAIETGDFLLPLIDPTIEDNKRYITTGASGTIQLILGFQKPFIMHTEVASFYQFSGDEGITYTDGGLGKAMEKALTISEKTYKQQQYNIGQKAKMYYHDSLRNLEKLIQVEKIK